MKFGEFRIDSPYWSRTSDYIWKMAENERPWQFGLFLLQDSKGSIKNGANSPRLAALIEKVGSLYQCQASQVQAWLEAEAAIGRCNFNEPVKDPLDPSVSWSEYNALAALRLLCQAGRAAIVANASDWKVAIANACLQAAQYRAIIVACRIPGPPAPSSPLYDERLKEIAAREAHMVWCEQAYGEAKEHAYRTMADHFGQFVSAHARQKREAAVQEQARIAALPFCQRWKHRLGRARQAT